MPESMPQSNSESAYTTQTGSGERRLRHLEILLDRSGSMKSVKEASEQGLEELLQAQKAVGAATTVTLRQFDDQRELVYSYLPLEEVPAFELKPRGRTALLDAIGWTITELMIRLDDTPVLWRPSEITVVVVTDDQENASQTYSRPVIQRMIERRRDRDGWNFVFLGADQDAITVGNSLGIAPDAALSYSRRTTRHSMATAGEMIARGSQSGTFAFTEDERTSAL